MLNGYRFNSVLIIIRGNNTSLPISRMFYKTIKYFIRKNRGVK
ncbi:hypothetical protein BC2926_52860 [Bacillus cereus]|nr:hypothetical protein BC2926_52860 [Bacillus cereus]